MRYHYDQLAGMIDHSLLHPTLTDRDLEDGCKLAVKYRVASVCLKPYHVRRAAQLLAGTGVRVGAVVGYPHGNSTTECKRYETEPGLAAMVQSRFHILSPHIQPSVPANLWPGNGHREHYQDCADPA